MEISLAYITDKGKVRAHNEDSYGIEESTPNGKVYVVCDGMGGHVGGATASNLAVTSILEYFRKEAYENIFIAIDKALQFANEQIYVHTLAEPSLKGMGTTAVVLVIKNDDCYIGHVGDSRIYLKTENKLHRITKDHSFVQSLVDSGVITDDQAESHPQKNQILRALGHGSEVKGTVSSSVIKVQKGDVFMLCSDGLNGMIHDSVMEQMIDPDNLEVSKLNLLNAAMENGGLDNITLVLVKVLSSGHYKHSVFESFNPGKPQNSNSNYEKHDETNLFPENKSATKPKPKKDNKLAVIIASASIVLCLGVLLFLKYANLGGKENGGGGKEENSYTKSDLEGKTYDQIEEIKEGKGIILSDVSDIKTKDNKEIKLVLNDDKTIKEIKKEEIIAVKPPPPPQDPNEDQGKNSTKVNTSTNTNTNTSTNNGGGINLKNLANAGVYPSKAKGFYQIEVKKGGQKISKLLEKINVIIKDSMHVPNYEVGQQKLQEWNSTSPILTEEERKSTQKADLKAGLWIIFKTKD